MTILPSRTPFRSVEEWKATLMTLPDNNFFELLRSVFGNIKTPFNKQRLLDDLFIFLSRTEIRKIIAAYIDGQDHKLIAAIALLDEPAIGDLEEFFAGEMSYAELHALVLNLEERLILYVFRDEGILRLALNPVLEPVLAPFIADIRLLFPGFHASQSFPLGSWEAHESVSPQAPLDAMKVSPSASPSGGKADERTLAAFFVFIFSEEEPLKAEGGLRKKILEEGKKFFPELDLELAVKTLLRLGLCRTGGEHRSSRTQAAGSDGHSLIPCGERIAEYGDLSPSERGEYWAAGVYLCLYETADNAAGNNATAHNGGFPADSGSTALPHRDLSKEVLSSGNAGGFHFSRNRLREIASLIHHFRILFEPENQYPEITLRRLWKLLEREHRGADNFWSSDSKVQLPFESVLKVMGMTGLLEREGNFWKAAGVLAPGSAGSERNHISLKQRFARQEFPAQNGSEEEENPSEPLIVMDTAFSFILYPEISFADALALGAFCTLKENSGTTVCFELTRSSAIRGFDKGIDSAAMIKLLNGLSHNRIDANLGWTLQDWESRYAGVSLHQGIILALAEDRRYLAEAEPVVSLIQRTLAPGVYLLSSDERSEAVKALRKAGVDIVAQPPSELKTGTAGAGLFRNSFPRLGSDGGESIFPEAMLAAHHRYDASPSEGGEKSAVDSADSFKQKFHRLLETMRLNKPERDELAARIERRLVLSETQLEGASLRYEKLEARGLDYAGKSVIAKQAIASGSLVEVSWPGPGGKINRIVGIPSALEKKDGDSILILIPGDTALQETLRIPLGKISLLRRIKQSIFGKSTTPT